MNARSNFYYYVFLRGRVLFNRDSTSNDEKFVIEKVSQEMEEQDTAAYDTTASNKEKRKPFQKIKNLFKRSEKA